MRESSGRLSARHAPSSPAGAVLGVLDRSSSHHGHFLHWDAALKAAIHRETPFGLIKLAMAGLQLVSLGAAARPGAVLTALRSSLFATYDLGGLEILVVSDLSELEPALQRLRAAAEAAAAAGCGRTLVYTTAPPRYSKAPLIGIDVEWRPDFRPGSDNPVALVQLAADGLCVLVRTCRLGFPAALRNFLRCAAAAAWCEAGAVRSTGLADMQDKQDKEGLETTELLEHCASCPQPLHAALT